MSTWKTIQSEVATWCLHNFGPQRAWQPMLGLVEEVGEYVAARDSCMGESGRLLMHDSIADQCIYALNLCEICGVDFPQVTEQKLRVGPADSRAIGALAAASHAVLKFEQGIRGVTEAVRRERLGAGLAIWYAWLRAQSELYSLRPALEVTIEVWAEVRKRDWRKNPTNANEIAAMVGPCSQCGDPHHNLAEHNTIQHAASQEQK